MDRTRTSWDHTNDEQVMRLSEIFRGCLRWSNIVRGCHRLLDVVGDFQNFDLASIGLLY